MKTKIKFTIHIFIFVIHGILSPAAGATWFPGEGDLFSGGETGKINENSWKFLFAQEFLLYNNADLKSYDDTTPQTVAGTDDFLYTPWSLIRAGYETHLTKRINFRIALSKAGFWGGDELSQGSVDNSSYNNTLGANPIAIDELFFTWSFSTDNRESYIRVGRQRFSIDSCWFDDTVDAITVLITQPWGTLNILALDWIKSVSALRALPHQLSQISTGSEQWYGYEGDSATLRFGLSYGTPVFMLSSVPGFSSHTGELSVEGWSFLLRRGAGEGGADRAAGWANFSDRDYTLLSGFHFQAQIPKWSLDLYGAYSDGIDRRDDSYTGESQDITTTGWSIRASLAHTIQLERSPFSLFLLASVSWSQGPQLKAKDLPFNPDNLPLASYGFSAFEGKPLGGLLLARYGGFMPHAIYSRQTEKSLYAPDWLFHRGGVFYVETLFELTWEEKGKLTTQFFWVQDASESLYIKNRLISKLPIGLEIDQSLTMTISSQLQLILTGAIFVPGEYTIAISGPGRITEFYGFSSAAILQF